MRAARAGESTPAISPALETEKQELQEGVSGEGDRLIRQPCYTSITDKARLQKHFNLQLFKTAEKRGFVSFIIRTDGEAICCNNNHRLTQSAKNTTKLHSNYIHNGISKKENRQTSCVLIDICIFIYIHIYI